VESTLSRTLPSSFNAILLDYPMPEMNGHEFASEIKRLRPDTRVVMVSGSEIPEEIRQQVDAVVTRKMPRGSCCQRSRGCVSG
jgi:CheY-like chemotaxis protein